MPPHEWGLSLVLIHFEPFRTKPEDRHVVRGKHWTLKTSSRLRRNCVRMNASFGRLRTQYRRRWLCWTQAAWRSTPIGDSRLYGSYRDDVIAPNFRERLFHPEDIEKKPKRAEGCLGAWSSVRIRASGAQEGRPVPLVPDSIQSFSKRARTGYSMVCNGHRH